MNPKKKKQALFLYFELAGYFVACLQKLVKLYDVEAHVVRLPVNPVAPFKFESGDGIFYYERKDYNLKTLAELVIKINPDFIFCNGWADKDYVSICKLWNGKIPTVLTLDNPWRCTIKQIIATLIGPFYLPGIFSHAWVPGKPQVIYSEKLGFKPEQIITGMYSADFDLFNTYYQIHKTEKEKKFPKRFLFIGRYTKLKGVKEMWQAFVELQNEMPNDWELWCIGKGELDADFPKHNKIKNFGFVQPKALDDYIVQTGVFLLPAYYEHWGVVVHEFAIAGFPLLCSTTTSAATTFLKDNYNGYFHKPYSVSEIKTAMKKIIELPETKLIEMGNNSHELSCQITPETWSKTVWDFCNLQLVDRVKN